MDLESFIFGVVTSISATLIFLLVLGYKQNKAKKEIKSNV